MAGNFGDATAFYDLTFKIISVHVEGFEKADGMKVVVRFAEKCLIISSGEEAKVDEKKSIRGASQGNRGRSRSKDSKKIESHTSNDADDEATDGSKGGQAKSKSTKELFGSLTERFVTSPRCMTEKLSKHCIKYEILSSSGDSIATASQQLNECFAYAVNSENFSMDNVNMRLLLMKPQDLEGGTMDVCVTVQRMKHDSSSDLSVADEQ